MMRGVLFSLICLLCALSAHGQNIRSAQDLYEFLEPEREVNKEYWNTIDSVKAMGIRARKFLPNCPKNYVGLFNIRYTFFSDLRFDDFDNQKANKNLRTLETFIDNTPRSSRDFDFSLQAALAYNTLNISFKRFGDQAQAREAILTANEYLHNALKQTNGDSTKYYNIIHKMIGINNNMGTLLYHTTHYLDSEEKRSETGSLLETYFDRVDSLFEVEDKRNSEFIDIRSRVSPYTNMAVIYGSYYRNRLKGEKYLEKARELGVKLCSTDPGFACVQAGIHFQGVLGWIEFANKNYRSAVEILKPSLAAFDHYNKEYPDLTNIYGHFKIDMLCALNESYYHLNKIDSSLYYGERLLADSTISVDYVVLANASVLMSELYMDRNIKRSRELLSLSRKLVQLSEAEMVRSKYVAEGESKLLNQTENKLFVLTENIVLAEQRERYILRILMFLGLCVVGIVLFIMINNYRKPKHI